MNMAPDDERHGTEILGEEIRAEASRLAHHPLAETKRLEGVAEEGESAATPLILLVGLIIVLVAVFAIVVAIALLAYYKG